MTTSETDIVVGVSTRNCSDTIAGVLEEVDKGLARFFPDLHGLIVVSDGFSTDGTRDIASKAKTVCEKVVVTEEGELGKGSAVRTIFKIAHERGAQAVALVDGDLTSIRPDWIKRLVSPIVGGKDLVVPYYLRYRYDGVITNQIAYPLTDVLFGLGVRQPIGGEYGLSARLIERLLPHPLFPAKFGIDIFITLVSGAEEMELVEAVLGVKEHESTKQYADPEELLVPMFYQVVGTLFQLIDHYRDYIDKVDGVKAVERLGKIPHVQPHKLNVDKEGIYRQFHAKYDEFIRDKAHFLDDLKSDLESVYALALSEFSFPLELWVKSVYLAIDAFSRDQDLKVLDALRVLWQGRFLSLVLETGEMSDDGAEAYIQGQLATFQGLRSMIF
ncbi:MAG: glycosyltransferase [Candidatus Bipolaricaulota bacterium]|nr:glycosyltransferase [Candidatus Bipolaricaulota bacterium]